MDARFRRWAVTILILLACDPLIGHAFELRDDLIEITSYGAEIDSLIRGTRKQCDEFWRENKRSHRDWLTFGNDTRRFEAPSLDCGNLTPENFCKTARDACDHYDTAYCFARAPEIQGTRATHAPLAKDISGFTRKRFAEILGDEAFQDACCGSDRRCRKMFSETRLVVRTGLGAGEDHAHYLPEGASATRWHQIEVSEAALLNCYNEECIEGMVLHELGHACQYSLIPGTQARIDFNKRFESQQNCDDRTPVPGLKERLGEETAACVSRKLGEAADNAAKAGRKVCYGAWQNEAFANSVFAHLQPSLYHWAWPCSGGEDSGHAAVKSYLTCILERPSVRSQFCR